MLSYCCFTHEEIGTQATNVIGPGSQSSNWRSPDLSQVPPGFFPPGPPAADRQAPGSTDRPQAALDPSLLAIVSDQGLLTISMPRVTLEAQRSRSIPSQNNIFKHIKLNVNIFNTHNDTLNKI